MNVQEFEKKVAEYVKSRDLFGENSSSIVTLSGGADSVALLRVLLSLGVKCVALHCNFGLRGAESDRDEDFVRNLCDIQGVRLKVKHFNVGEYERTHKVSTEMACRELRYAWFEQERQEQKADFIAVAHHHDDNVETFFLNMLRGSGIQGLSGIKPKNGNIVRPLLCVAREEIEEYLTLLGQDYVTDSTNLENDYKRNKIRNVLIPTIKDLFPNADAGLTKTLQNIQGCNELYQNEVNDLRAKVVTNSSSDSVVIDLRPIKELRQGEETALFEMLKDYGFNSVQVSEIYEQLRENRFEGQSYFSENYEAVPGRSVIEIFKRERNGNEVVPVDLKALLNGENEHELPFAVRMIEKEQGIVKPEGVDGRNVIALNVRVLEEENIVYRRWQSGDKIRPFGLNGSKTVANLLADAKYTVAQKRNTWVFAVGNEVLWVPGLRASGRFSVGVSDRSYIEIRC